MLLKTVRKGVGNRIRRGKTGRKRFEDPLGKTRAGRVCREGTEHRHLGFPRWDGGLVMDHQGKVEKILVVEGKKSQKPGGDKRVFAWKRRGKKTRCFGTFLVGNERRGIRQLRKQTSKTSSHPNDQEAGR